LAALSTFAEATLYRSVVEKVNVRVGRYLFFMLAFSAGMWKASTALLPSSFAMYTTAIATGYAMGPSSVRDTRKPWIATLLFATGAIVGWPFALALSLPFVFEELFVFGGDRVPAEIRQKWLFGRWSRMTLAVLASAFVFVSVLVTFTRRALLKCADPRSGRGFVGIRSSCSRALEHHPLQHLWRRGART
jgi:alpha-1,2-mannosyltransferase